MGQENGALQGGFPWRKDIYVVDANGVVVAAAEPGFALLPVLWQLHREVAEKKRL